MRCGAVAAPLLGLARWVELQLQSREIDLQCNDWVQLKVSPSCYQNKVNGKLVVWPGTSVPTWAGESMRMKNWWLVGGFPGTWPLFFQKQLEMSSSQLTNSNLFQRARAGLNHQPDGVRWIWRRTCLCGLVCSQLSPLRNYKLPFKFESLARRGQAFCWLPKQHQTSSRHIYKPRNKKTSKSASSSNRSSEQKNSIINNIIKQHHQKHHQTHHQTTSNTSSKGHHQKHHQTTSKTSSNNIIKNSAPKEKNSWWKLGSQSSAFGSLAAF